MGISFSIPFDPCINKVSHCLDEKVGYTHNLQKNIGSLETTLDDLKAKRDDLLRRVTREEDKGLERLAEIQVWLTRVETVEKKVNDLLSARNVELERLYFCGFCSKSLLSRYRYGKRVFLMLREVENLKCCGEFEVVAEKDQTYEVEERPLQPIIVGQETMLKKAWNHLLDDEVGIMGLYGMGGVGKTTLLAQINNKFTNVRCVFDFVIWIVVSKELHLEKIQDEIAQRVGLGGEEWKQKEKSQKADVIYKFLRKKIFVLFLDDIWEKLDLAEIGVPFPTTQNRCKIVFTTRSQDVCAHMGVEDPMEVQCLAEDDAFDLFQKKVGKITLRSDPEIPELARIVAKKCCGLPLAVNVIGETMSCKRTTQEWRHAIDVLNSYAREFSGMKDKILPLLKYSYDNLKGEQAKSCLLYCSLFPEDYDIPKEKLIGYWICEGIIDGSEDIEKAENKGYEIIGSLVRASLLTEKVGWDETNSLCMHDVVREMALWIASDLGTTKGAFIVHAGVGLQKMPKVSNWDVVRRMSLMNNKLHYLDGNPKCVELTTLLLQKTNLAIISSEFFKSMPRLVVLDLSDNKSLVKLPDRISELVSLQYLDLSKTSLYQFPMGLQKLSKLIYLDLEETTELRSIAGISSLQNLKVLKLCRSGFSWDQDNVEELETLEHLEFLTSGFHLQDRKHFLSSDRLTSCTRALTIRESHRESSVLALPATMDKLRYFFIGHCSISEIKMGRICIKSKTISPLHNPRNPCFLSLSIVLIAECKFLRELTWLMFAPNLRSLSVSYSNQLEDIINKDKAYQGKQSGIVPFVKLNHLKLKRLPKLRNIYSSPLPFPCLKRIDVIYCPNLKKLPLNSQSCTGGENGLIIRYSEKEWVDDVKWEDEATETRFLLLFQQPRGLMGFD